MKYLQHIIYLAAFLSILYSCEDVIELELDNTDPRIIVEAIADIETKTVSVLVTESNDFYAEAEPQYITDAGVSIIAENGEVTGVPLNGDSYLLEDYDMTSTESYELEVTVDGISHRATTSAPMQAPSLSVDTLLDKFPFGDELFYRCSYRWQDVLDTDNYYRVQAVANDTVIGRLSLYKDTGIDGEEFVRPLMAGVFPGDFVEFQLMNVDRFSYDYLVQIEALEEQGFGGSTPFNPKGNFDNNALGYFGIRSISTVTIQF